MQNNAPKSARLPHEVLTSHHFINRISRFLNKAESAAHHFHPYFKEGGAVRGLACSSFPILLDAKRGPLRSWNFLRLEISGRYPSGQRGQTVNLLPWLPRFESLPAHHSRQCGRQW